RIVFPLVGARADTGALRELPHHVDEVPGLLVLALVVLASNRAHGMLGEHVQLLAGRRDRGRELVVDHGRPPCRRQATANPSNVAKPRAFRRNSSTKWSRMYPWPPSTWRALSVIFNAASAL